MSEAVMAPRFTVKLVRETKGKGDYKHVRTPEDLGRLLEWMKDLDREQFVVVLLDTRHQVIGINVVSTGTISSSLVHPREVFKAAILSNAHAIALAHNHPTGNTQPSREDIETTRQLMRASEIMGMEVVDHLVIGDTVYSIRENYPDLWPS